MNSIYQSRAQAAFLDNQRDRAISEERAFRQQATPENAARMASFSTRFPNSSSELGLYLTLSGVPPDDPMVEQVVNLEQTNRQVNGPTTSQGGGLWNGLARGLSEFVYDPAKGIARWGMMGLMAVYEETVGGAQIRTATQMQREGMGYAEAHEEQGSFLANGLRDAFRDPGATLASIWAESTTADVQQEASMRAEGAASPYAQTVNTGNGWFANSSVDPEVERLVREESAAFQQTLSGMTPNQRYTAELEESPQIWNRAVETSMYQAALSAPMTQQGYADREAVMYQVPHMGQPGTTWNTPYSPGRWAAATIFEPGTTAFSRVSGVGDIASQMFLDPTNLAAGLWAKAGRNGRTVGVTMRKVAGKANDVVSPTAGMRASTVTPDNSVAKFRGLVEGERNPILAFGGQSIDDISVEKARAVVGDHPDYTAMLDEGVWFNDPAGYRAWTDMRDKVSGQITRRGKPVEFDDIRQVAMVDGLSDDTLEMLDDIKLQVGGSKHDPYRWMSPDEYGNYHLGPDDPPEWMADQYRRMEAGGQDFDGLIGQSMDDFMATGEDLYLSDGVIGDLNSIDQTDRFHLSSDSRPMRSAKSTAGDAENAKVRVFGRTLDATSGKLPDDLPPKLVEELKKFGYYSESTGLDIGANPFLYKSWDRISNILVREGYGKIKIGDDWLILDDMIGGAKADPLGRISFGYADRPMMNGMDDAAGATNITPAEMNANIERLQELGRWGLDADGKIDPNKLTKEALDQFSKDHAEEIGRMQQAVDDGINPGRTIDGTRPSVDVEVPVLTGKKSNLFVDDLWRITQTGDEAAGRMDSVMEKFSRQGITVPIGVREDLLQATSRDDIAKTLANWMGGIDGPKKMVLPGGTQYGRLRAIDSLAGAARGKGVFSKVTDSPWVARRFADMMPRNAINLMDEPDQAYSTLARILPNYNVTRGQAGVKYFDMNGMERTTQRIEDVMAGFRRLEPGDTKGGHDLMTDYTEILFATLTEGRRGISEAAGGRKFLLGRGVDDTLASHATRWMSETGEMALYNQERLGMTHLGGAVGDNLRLSGNAEHMPGMNATVEAWNGSIAFPDARMVKRVANYSDRMGQIGNFIAAKKVVTMSDGSVVKARKAARKAYREMEGKKKKSERWTLQDASAEVRDHATDFQLQDRVSYLAASAAMQKVWKPLVLLRGAWTLRILIDDQMRIAAEGYSSMFTHPVRYLNYAMSLPKGTLEGVGKGFMDINGVRVSMKNIDDVRHAALFRRSQMAMPDGRVGKGAYGSNFAKKIPQSHPKYAEGLATKLADASDDPLSRVIAGSTADDPINEGVKLLQGGRPDLEESLGFNAEKMRADIAAMQFDDPELIALVREGTDEEVLRKIVTQRYNDLHYATGGDVVIDNGSGRWLSYGDDGIDETDRIGQAPKARPDSSEQIAEVVETGDSELLAVIADGHGNMDFPLTKDGGVYRIGFEEFTKIVGDKVAAGKRFPTHSYAVAENAGGYGQKMDQTMNSVVGRFYEYLMTKPSDTLSRSPLFGQAYWRTIGERIPYMSDEVREITLAKAKAAGVLPDVKRAAKNGADWMTPEDLKGAKGMLSVDEGSSADELWDALDEQGKAGGLAQVERTLFDMVNKKNVSDSLTLLFPFVEAWGEFASRWSRLMVTGDRAAKNANRLQQGVNGLRESDPFDPQSGEGFFHTNEFGDEVFSYPAFLTKAQINVHNLMTNIPGASKFIGGKIDSATADAIKATGSVESMNFAAGIIPGFGPVFQLGAKTVLDDNPKWDGIKRLVAPFGMEGGAAQMAPAWIKRIMSANGSSDPALNATYQGTVVDVLRTMMNDGEFENARTKPEFEALSELAEERARGLLMVRAYNTFWAPSSPTYTFGKEDPEGKVWAYGQIGEEYRNIIEQHDGDQVAAADVFQERFGYLPYAFTGSESYLIKQRSTTNAGYRFQRENPGFFDDYSATAMFLDPTIGEQEDDYNHAVTVAQLRTGEKEKYTAEQFSAIADRMLGRLEWDNLQKRTADIKEANPDQWEALQMQGKLDIMERHPYYPDREISGVGAGVQNEEQIEEVQKWMGDDRLRGVPVVEAARAYLGERNAMLAMLEAEYGLGSLDGSQKPYAIEARAGLRQIAERLLASNPQFEALYNNVFASEIATWNDGYADEPVDFFGGDLFSETLGVPASDVPRFDNPNFGGPT